MKKVHLYFILFNVLFLIVSFANLNKVVPFDIKSLLPEKHPVRIEYENYLKAFNDENQVVLQLRAKNSTFSESEVFQLSEQIIGYLKKDPRVDKVLGPSNIFFFRVENDKLKTVKFFEAGRLSDRGLTELKKPFWKNSFLTENRDSFLVSFGLKKTLRPGEVKSFITDLSGFVVGLNFNDSFDYGLTGAKVVSQALLKEMITMHVVIAPILLFIIASFFYYMYRSIRIVFWSLYIILFTLACTLLLIIFVEKGLGPYSTFAIIFSAIVATADLIQFWSRYIQLEGSAEERLKKAFRISRFPCLLTSLTTAIGFFALILNQNLPIKYFGLYCTFACIVEWFLIFYGQEIIFKYFKIDEPRVNFVPEKNDRFVQKLILKWPKSILVASALFLVTFTYYSTKLKVDDNFYAKFVDSHSFSQSVQLLSRSFNYVGSIDVVFYLKDKKAFSETNLNAIRNVEKDISEIKNVVRLSSISQFDKSITAEKKMRDEIYDLLNFYNISSSFYNEKENVIRTSVYVNSFSSETLSGVMAQIKQLEKKHQGSIDFRVSGFAPVRAYINSQVVNDFFGSFLMSFVLIYICYYWLYRDVKLSFLALLPNALPVLCISGFLGMFDIFVDSNLILLVCIAFGISGDNTIQLSYVIKEYQKEGMSYDDALRAAFKLISSALWGTSILFILVLPIFLIGDLKLFSQISILLMFSFAIAFLSDVIVFPAIQKVWKQYNS